MASENAQPEPAPFVFAKGTDVGRVRDHNEDYLDAFSPPDPVQRRQKGVLFVVADGMGGHQAGDVASQTAVEMTSHEYYADPDTDIRSSLIRAIKKANEFIYQEAQRTATRAGMGTTIVAAVVRGRELYLANVGDSRAYMMRQGKVAQATRDHSFVAEQVRAGLLTLEEARAHPQRNVITRALGSRPEVKVDTYNGELHPGDALLLCTDGLSEYVREEGMLAVMSQLPPEKAVSRLIAMARDQGGSDNISALIVQAGPPAGVASTAPATRATRPMPAQRVRRRWLPWLAAGAAGAGLLGAAILVVVVFFPDLFPQEAAAPTVEPSPSTVATDESTATASPESAPTPTVDPTVTPRQVGVGSDRFVLEAPLPSEPVPPGPVALRWRQEGAGLGPAEFLHVCHVPPGGSESCDRAEGENSHSLQVQEEGTYEWWVEVQRLLQTTQESSHWKFTVGWAGTDAITETHTLTGTVQATDDGTDGETDAASPDDDTSGDASPKASQGQ